MLPSLQVENSRSIQVQKVGALISRSCQRTLDGPISTATVRQWPHSGVVLTF